MSRILCFFGLRRWAIHKKVVEYADRQNVVERRYEYCQHCRKTRDWLELD